ncbi:LOW QUALITY PROTEIN: structural maintenance of chromosomes protein 2-like [Paramacrobiotus metropolitanus]|uniref:LOW QUALITY PROTEIN: structural maintenance of chromosomes protein 2-like n=1 Tax=Paramacrobiotus metropolitanus TaxID=2943436 RepID=UPI002445976A|nr:LOW QUALITY PROTEIN: structural maintenance of chromosomes protein 2-like [Paramacrobiotus metropolitanus]
MHIKEITLHGFKSYGAKTKIAGFDPHFNAITGLNGCGKSNILDAICFLLGQNAPTQFRVGNLQELVYKKGAGGISFASVAIVFDNSDQRQTPLTYSKFKEITVERKIQLGAQGKSKYTINGANATLTQVQDMFRSVQLNIQNPHFLIMQGRIVKVLSMKPEEIWKMVEEAAGTMVYMTKRDNTLKMVNGKQKRIAEVDDVIQNTINPKMKRLDVTRQNNLEYNRINREIDKKELRKAAADTWKLKEQATRARNKRNECKASEKELDEKIKTDEGKLVAMSEEIQQMESDQNHNEDLNRLEERSNQARRKVVELQSAIESNQNLITEELNAIAENKREISNKQAGLAAAEADLNTAKESYAKDIARKAELEREVQRAQQALAVIVTGVGGEENAEFGWKNQCQAAERELNELERNMNIKKGTLENLKRQLVGTNQNRQRLQREHAALMDQLKGLDEQVKLLEAQLEASPQVDREQMAALRENQRRLLGEKATVEQQMGNLDGEMRSFHLQYQRPRNFDERKYYGAVATLFKVSDKTRFLAAIDAATGGRKFNFAVEDDITAKSLLTEGQIRRRVTILPLNRMRGPSISDAEMERIRKKVGAHKVWTALQLVEYDQKFQSVMQYAMGSYVVCSDLDTANKVAFDPSLGKHCVTLDGDTVNPDGIMSGGTRTALDRLPLNHIAKYTELRERLDEIQRQLREIDQQTKELDQQDGKRRELETKLHEKRNEWNALNHKCDQNSELRNLREADRMREDAEKLQTELDQGDRRSEELRAKVNDLRAKLNDKNAGEKEKRDAEKHEARCRENVRKHEAEMAKTTEKEAEKQASVDDIRKSILDLEAEIVNRQAAIKTYEGVIDGKQTTLVNANEIYSRDQAAYTQMRNEMLRKTGANWKKPSAREKANLEKTKKLSASCKEDLKKIETLLNEEMFKQFPWLADEYDKLGTAESAYAGIENEDPAELAAEIEGIKKRKTELQRQGGTEQHLDYDQIERQYEELLKKNDLCKADKKRLEEIIEQLDLKKQHLIELAVHEVNKHFGAIFKTLLPNADCKLEREVDEDNNLIESLRIRVALGNMWKESLSELSGGQRSLVALSLILAMLKMNPAPIYILDEIDAALDLSHTHNVGRMIRKYFKQSQFIIVSLKEGMFNNANVLYRVTFGDGVSQVERRAKPGAKQYG